MPMIVAPPVPVPAIQDDLPVILPFVEVPEWLPLVRTALTARIGAERLTILDGLLQECGAVIAGGSILKSVVAWNPEPAAVAGASVDTPNDMDIYVPIRTVSRFIDRMFTATDPMFAVGTYSVITANRYCTSFLRKNGIRRVHTFKLPENATIDIMSIRNRRTPQQVVTNFDLTFCQVWYDGAKVYTTHLDDIRTKRGSLQEDYIQNLRDANIFIRNRIKKYIARGFTVLVNGVPYDPATFHGNWRDIRQAKRTAWERSCYAPGMSASRRSMPEYWTKWVASIFTAWSVRTMYDISLVHAAVNGAKSMIMPAGESLSPINIVIPLTSNFDIGSLMNRGIFTEARLLTFWANYPDTGYDSEDYEILDNKKFMAKQIMTKFGFNIPEDQALALIGNRLLELQLFPTKYRRVINTTGGLSFRFLYNLGALYYNKRIHPLPGMIGDQAHLQLSVIDESKEHLTNELIRITPVALDFSEANSRVFDIHLHTLNEGISKDKFLTHLKRHKLFPKDKIPCYTCDKLLTFTEIYHIIGPEDYNIWHGSAINAPSDKWKGYTRGDIAFLDIIFSRDGKDISDWSFCPVCLSYVSRIDGCNYISGHKCFHMNVPFSRPLYEKYRDVNGNIQWCTQCGRICKDHRHYQLSLADGPVPAFGPPGSAFDKNCRNTGGGGIPEKFIRFSQLRETALALQAKVHLETNANVKNELIIAIWNAPVLMSAERKAEINAMFPPAPDAYSVPRNNVRSYALSTNLFPLVIPPAPPVNAAVVHNNNLVYPNIPYPNGAGADPLLPIIHSEGDDAASMETVRPAIQFIHRRQNGEVNLHQDEYIGLKNYFNLLKFRNDEYKQGLGGDFGMCWNFPTCNAKIHPQEILAILTRLDTNAGDYPEVTPEDKARYRQIYNEYKKLFNKLFREPVAGGRRKTHRRHRQAKQHGGNGDNGSFFVEATDAQCSVTIPNGSKAGVGKRKTRRQRRR